MLQTMLSFPQSLAFGMPGPWEWIIILAVMLLLFGRRLPEVGASLGRGIVEFKKGLHGLEEEIDKAGSGSGEPAKSGSKPSLESSQERTVAQSSAEPQQPATADRPTPAESANPGTPPGSTEPKGA